MSNEYNCSEALDSTNHVSLGNTAFKRLRTEYPYWVTVTFEPAFVNREYIEDQESVEPVEFMTSGEVTDIFTPS